MKPVRRMGLAELIRVYGPKGEGSRLIPQGPERRREPRRRGWGRAGPRNSGGFRVTELPGAEPEPR